MKHDFVPKISGGLIRFAPTFNRYIARVPSGEVDISVADDADIAEVLPMIRRTLPIAGDSVIALIRQHAPDAFTIMRGVGGGVNALLATLPLNAAGAAALVAGRFDPRNPNLQHLASVGESPAAVYIWLLWAPGRLPQGLVLVNAMLRKRGVSCPLFSRPATTAAERLHRVLGFGDAVSIYPEAPQDLRVILPEISSSSPTIHVRVARALEDVLQAFAIRSATYMVEQDCPYSEEFDGNDFAATHLIASIDGEPAACARIRWFGDFAKIERMAVLQRFRQSRAVFRLARYAIEYCRRKGFSRIYAHSRADLLPLWGMFGLQPVPERVPFSFSGVGFREVYCDLDPHPRAIRFGVDPMITNRPEGGWDEPGPLEKITHRSNNWNGISPC